MIPTIGVSHCEPNWANIASNACITPAVSDSWSAGTTQLMASAGRMKISRTRPIDRNIDLGNSLPGFRSEETCTAFISMPEYDRKLLTISTRLDRPAHAGSRCRGGHRGGRLVALTQEDRAEQDQHHAGDQRADDQPAAGQPGHRAGAAGGHPHAGPVADHDDDRGPQAVRRQVRVDHVRERAGHEAEQAGVVEDGHRELAPDREEPHRFRDALADPVVDAAAPAGCQLRRDQRGRQQEHDGRHDVEEDAGQPVHGHGRRRAQTGHRTGRHEGQRDPRYVVDRPRLRGGRGFFPARNGRRPPGGHIHRAHAGSFPQRDIQRHHQRASIGRASSLAS